MIDCLVLQSMDSPRRDFEWRLYMARKLADEGISSVIAGARQIRRLARSLRGCIYLGRRGANTGRSAGDMRFLRVLDGQGHKVFYLHDEGAFFHGGFYKESARQMHPIEYLSEPCFERLYFWGEKQRAALMDDVPAALREKKTSSR